MIGTSHRTTAGRVLSGTAELIQLSQYIQDNIEEGLSE
jgi:hypothetical protein